MGEPNHTPRRGFVFAAYVPTQTFRHFSPPCLVDAQKVQMRSDYFTNNKYTRTALLLLYSCDSFFLYSFDNQDCLKWTCTYSVFVYPYGNLVVGIFYRYFQDSEMYVSPPEWNSTPAWCLLQIYLVAPMTSLPPVVYSVSSRLRFICG